MKKFTKQLDIRSKNGWRVLLVAVMSISIAVLAYTYGKTVQACSQLNYIVIILAAYYWQTKGSVTVALILGLSAGPLMSIISYGSLSQHPLNWILRVAIYLFVALNVGYIFNKNIEKSEEIKEKNLISDFTGFYNTNKLFLELGSLIEKGERFCLVFINVVNLEEISKYVDYDIIETIIHRGTKHLKSVFKEENLYSVDYNEYLIIQKEYDETTFVELMTKYLEMASKTMVIEDYSFKLVIKIGISFNNGDISEAREIYNKARIAADQGEVYKSGVYVCNDRFRKEKELFNEISGSIQKALDNDEFYLVYQPIVSLTNKELAHAEVLLRWDRGERGLVGPDIFIPIAEKIGLIKHITTWIIKKLITEKKEWKNKGVNINTAINVTSVEILDDSFRDWVEVVVKENDIERSSVGIEITERVILNDEKKINGILSSLREKGYKISMDDFGTGYNSLINVSKIPFDIIKIDKYFVDRMNELEIYLMIKHTISFIHELGGTVIAEGVETKEQLEMLKELGCDSIQGYYFSKPLVSDEFMEYYKNFDINDYL
ncbi:GGDEF domain-containing protein [Clostridia bacterium]|nr:GGDEF domain-containing protein [Clostridia bacterium]